MLTDFAVEALRDQIELAGSSPYLFPSDDNNTGHQTTFKTAWRLTLRRAKVPYFRIYDLRSTYATRLSAGGVADEWVTQRLRQGDAKVFKKYSQMKLQMKREALQKLNRTANESVGQTGKTRTYKVPVTTITALPRPSSERPTQPRKPFGSGRARSRGRHRGW